VYCKASTYPWLPPDGSSHTTEEVTASLRRVLHNVNLVDGTGNGPQKNVALVIEGEHIEDVIPAAQAVAWNDGTEVIDGRGRWVIPGLMDLHVHISTWHGQPDAHRYKHYQAAKAAVLATARIREALLGGVTTIRDVGSVHGASIALKEGIESGLITGSRVIPCDKIICVTGGHGHDVEGMYREADGLEDVRKAVREQLRAGAECIKLCNTHRSPVSEFRLAELEAAVDEAHRLGVRVACHAGIEPGLGYAVRAGVDTIEHGNLPSDETIREMAERGTFWVPTVSVNRGLIDSEKAQLSGEQFREIALKMVRSRELSEAAVEAGVEYYTRSFVEAEETFHKVREAGVRIACGTDVDASTDAPNSLPMHAARNEVKWFVRFGMSPEDAIIAATRTSAEALGREKRIGTLQKGKLADLLLVRRNPVEDINAIDEIDLVVKEGEPIGQ